MSTRAVSNRFFVTAIADNSTMSAVLYVDGSLTQVYNPQTGAGIPDWTSTINTSTQRPNNQLSPQVYSIVKVNGDIKAVRNPKWFYNNIELQFDSNHYSLANSQAVAGTFYCPDVAEYGRDVDGSGSAPKQPILLVIKNLANSSNPDNDVITLTGSVEVSGTTLDFSINQPVRITVSSGDGYLGYIDGDSAIESADPNDPEYTASMDAYLFYGGSPVQSFSTKWYRMGIDTDTPSGGWPKVVNATETSPYRHATATINADDVFDNVVMKVDFYTGQNATGNLVYTAFFEVDDLVDDDEMRIVYNPANGENAFIRKDEEVKYYFWMSKQSNTSYVNPAFKEWKLKISDNTSKVIPITVNKSNEFRISDGSGTPAEIDVRVEAATTLPNGVTAPQYNAGRATIGYDFTVSHGYTITGFVIARGEVADLR